MPYFYILPPAIILCVIFIFLEVKGNPVTAFWFKGFASFAFVALAVAAVFRYVTGQNPDLHLDVDYYAFFILGLVCGLLGDLYLALRSLRPKIENSRLILGGTICFAIGHLFYYYAMIWRFGISGIAILVAVALTVVVVIASRWMKMDWGNSKVSSSIYTFLVFLVAAEGVHAFVTRAGDPLSALVCAGGILFAASDLILSQIYFKGKTGAPYIITNLVTYYAAQICLALSLYFLP